MESFLGSCYSKYSQCSMAAHLYQTIHTLDGEVLHLEEHLRLLEGWAKEFFRLSVSFSVESLREEILSTLSPSDRGCGRSCYVRMELFADGKYNIEMVVRSLYRGYVMRRIYPQAVAFRFDPVGGDRPTSSLESSLEMAQAMIDSQELRSVLRIDGQGSLSSIDGYPLFAVRGRSVIAPKGVESVERMVAISAIKEAGLELLEQELKESDLSSLDELFYCNHVGVTAISRCGDTPYMHIVCERVAESMR